MKKPKVKKAPFATLEISEKYDDFIDFYSINKIKIYNFIVNIFEELRTANKDALTLHLSATISNVLWETDFTFNKEDYFIMKRDLLPYFEDNEEYETCKKIMDITKEYELVS